MRTHMRLWLPLVLGLLLFVAACDATQEDLAEHDDDITSNTDADDQSDVDADDGDSDDDADTADDFPNRTINYVVPAAAGGSSDAIARIVEEYGSEYIGGDLVVENRDGAAGTLAVAEVMGAEPDGHTLVQPPVGPFTTQDYFQDLQYSVDDFEPVINLTNESNVLAALTERGWETVDDMITE